MQITNDENRALIGSRGFEPYILPAMLIAAALLRIYRLGADSFWTDELFHIMVAKEPLLRVIFPTILNTGDSPLDYVITHFALGFLGQSEGMLRLPDVLWGILSIYAIFQLGKLMFDKVTAYLSAALLTILPLHIQYSREVRYYILPTLLVILSVYFLLRALAANKRWLWVAYYGTTVLALYSQLYMAVAIGLLSVWALLSIRKRREVLRNFLFVTLAIGLTYGPWVAYVVLGQKQTLSWSSTPVEAGDVIAALFFDTTVGGRLVGENPPIEVFKEVYYAYQRTYAWGVGLYGILLVMGTYAVIRRRAKVQFRRSMGLLLLMTIGGVGAFLLFDAKTGYPFAARQFLIYSPFAILAVAGSFTYLISQIAGQRRQRVLIGASTLLCAASLAIWWSRPLPDLYQAWKMDWRGTARFLLHNVGPHDVLLTPFTDFLEFYAPELRSNTPVEIPGTLADAQALIHPNQRVWIVLVHSPLYPRPSALADWIQKENLPEISLNQVNHDFEVYQVLPKP